MDDVTRYRLGNDNPLGTEWVVVMEPASHGFSLTISNDPRYQQKLDEQAKRDAADRSSAKP